MLPLVLEKRMSLCWNVQKQRLIKESFNHLTPCSNLNSQNWMEGLLLASSHSRALEHFFPFAFAAASACWKASARVAFLCQESFLLNSKMGSMSGSVVFPSNERTLEQTGLGGHLSIKGAGQFFPLIAMENPNLSRIGAKEVDRFGGDLSPCGCRHKEHVMDGGPSLSFPLHNFPKTWYCLLSTFV